MRKLNGKYVIAVEELEQLLEMRNEAYEALEKGPEFMVPSHFFYEMGAMRPVFGDLPTVGSLNPGVIAFPCWSMNKNVIPLPILVAVGEGPALNAEEWGEVLVSDITLMDLRIADLIDGGMHSYSKIAALLAEDTGEGWTASRVALAHRRLYAQGYIPAGDASIVGGDPAAAERDPDADEVASERRELIMRSRKLLKETGLPSKFVRALLGRVTSEQGITTDEFSGPAVVAPLGELLEVSGEFGPRRMAESEGRAYGREILGTGATAAEVRRNTFVPCPYPMGTPARVWWIKGLLEELKDAEVEAARASAQRSYSPEILPTLHAAAECARRWSLEEAAEQEPCERLIREDGSDDDYIIAHAQLMDEMLAEDAAKKSAGATEPVYAGEEF